MPIDAMFIPFANIKFKLSPISHGMSVVSAKKGIKIVFTKHQLWLSYLGSIWRRDSLKTEHIRLRCAVRSMRMDFLIALSQSLTIPELIL